jgi:Predicted esterase of the alpha-beta hydrolase superfamily
VKIAFALGSGGPKGLAHIGIMKVLLGEGILPSIITGSSIGALIGGAYAKLGSIEKVENIATSSDMKTVLTVLFDPTLKMGIVRGKKVTNFIEKNIGDAEISSLVPKFFPVATNFNTGESFVFESGSLVTGIRASISIPIFFEPVRYKDFLLMDGGLSDAVPVKVAKEKGADFVIAVNLYGKLSETPYRKVSSVNFYKIFSDSIDILQYNLAKENCRDADVVIAPDVQDIGWDYFWKPVEVIERGVKAAVEKIPEIKEKLKNKK